MTQPCGDLIPQLGVLEEGGGGCGTTFVQDPLAGLGYSCPWRVESLCWRTWR